MPGPTRFLFPLFRLQFPSRACVGPVVSQPGAIPDLFWDASKRSQRAGLTLEYPTSPGNRPTVLCRLANKLQRGLLAN